MKNIRKIISIIMLVMICTVFLGNGYNVSAEVKTEKSTIWVIGDSTVSEFDDNYYYPRYGYGTQLQQYFDSSKYEVKNLALSGRSSKNYITNSNYKTLLKGMKDGDYLVIGFGHNDQKLDESRYTNPNGTYTDEGSFANSIYMNYIIPAEEAGCNVILCTPIVRRTSSEKWSNSNLHITNSTDGFEGGDYPQAIRDLGKDLNIPVVDLTKKTKELYDELGVNETLNLHSWTSSNSASIDNTHTNIWGATYNAYFIAEEIKSLNLDNISDAIVDEKIEKEPTKESTLVVNPNYVETEYDSNLTESELWTNSDIWKGTVFGNIGGTVKKDNFVLEASEDGKINIAVKNNKGKIASTDDGIAMFYYKVPANSIFSISATATINSLDYNNQVSFGLMARDEMYIDEYTTSALGDYVAAAPLKITDSKAWGSFARKSGVLTKGGTIENTSINVGDTIELKIESNIDGYACTFGNEETITGGFDFPLTIIDSEYVYVGMFVSRNADITFDNIKLIVDGVEVTDSNNGETPEVPEAPEVPEIPETPEEPEVPEVPEIPETPEEPEIPEAPETPEIPKEETNNSDENKNETENEDVNISDKDQDNNDKGTLPSTGGSSSLIILTGALILIGVGSTLVKRNAN